MCSHVQGTLGGGVGVSPLQQIFLQTWHLQASQEEPHKLVNRGVALEGFVIKWWVGGSIAFNGNNHSHLYYISIHSYLVNKFHIRI